MKGRKNRQQLDPSLIAQEREALKRRHRHVILLNDRELAALDAYCSRFKVSSRAAALRRIVMERVVADLEDSHPTLF